MDGKRIEAIAEVGAVLFFIGTCAYLLPILAATFSTYLLFYQITFLTGVMIGASAIAFALCLVIVIGGLRFAYTESDFKDSLYLALGVKHGY